MVRSKVEKAIRENEVKAIKAFNQTIKEGTSIIGGMKSGRSNNDRSIEKIQNSRQSALNMT